MKVISRDTIERIVKCKCCKSIISYKNEDVKKGWNGRVIICPVCKGLVYVSRFDKKVKK